MSKSLTQLTHTAASALTQPAHSNDNKPAVRCLACGHRCVIADGKAGLCKMRFNRAGELRVPRGYVSGLAVDPVEKKPFYHVYPGQDALSFGMLGCNLHCSYCQNWHTSQALKDPQAITRTQIISPEHIVRLAQNQGTPMIVSTYNEPLITSDWAAEIFSLAKQVGLTCGFVSNGHATPEVLEFLRPVTDIFKVDLKSFNDRTYRGLGGDLQTVLDTITLLKDLDYWVEVVTLVVPGLNDSDQEMRRIAEFLAETSLDIPWHVTAFHPDYRLTEPPRTTAKALHRAYEQGKSAGLRYVYIGNLPSQVGRAEHTHCPVCDERLIERRGFNVIANHLDGNKCPSCGGEIPGLFDPVAIQQNNDPNNLPAETAPA